MTLVLVVNYGFLSSFRNVLPNSNLFVRKYTFHNTAFIVHAKAVTFEVTSLIVTSNWNEIWLALASSEKKSSHVHLGHKLTWPDPSLCNAVTKYCGNKQGSHFAANNIVKLIPCVVFCLCT